MTEHAYLPLRTFTQLFHIAFEKARQEHYDKQHHILRGPAIAFSSKLAKDFGGVLPTGITVLHGPPGLGKSALGQQIASESSCPSLILTFEMDPLEIFRREVARRQQTHITKLRNGSFSAEDWKWQAEPIVAPTEHLGILDGTSSPVSTTDLVEAIISWRDNSSPMLLVVDSASAWIRSSCENTKEYETTNIVITFLNDLAMQYNISILAIVEQNRTNRNTSRMEAALGSGLWEYAAQAVIALSRDNDLAASEDGSTRVDLHIAKNRYGPAGRTIHLRFQGSFMRFSEIADNSAIESTPLRKRKVGLQHGK